MRSWLLWACVGVSALLSFLAWPAFMLAAAAGVGDMLGLILRAVLAPLGGGL